MALPLGSTDVSASGGTMRLVGRIGEGRMALVEQPMPLDAAIDRLDSLTQPPMPVLSAGPLDVAGRSFFPPGSAVAWMYDAHVDMVRVVRDDAEGLVAWIPTGSSRLGKIAVDGRASRSEIPLAERFSFSWQMREGAWRGPGIIRHAPTGQPWSPWWFFDEQLTFSGLYVNLETPHRRPVDGDARTHSRDLALDFWIEPAADGCHELWVKDEDELDAATTAGRFTTEQREAVLAVGEWAARAFFDAGPCFTPWDTFEPTPEQNEPVPLPHTPLIAAMRSHRG